MKKVILVTGASSGIGKATALHLLKEGHTVYGAARRAEKMRDIIGIHKNFHTNEEYLFSEKLYKELTTLKLNKLSSPLSHLCLINMGDEVLNHEITKEFFHSSLVISEKHGSHEYINFRQRIGLLLDFLN